MEKKESEPTRTIEKVKAGHYDTRGFGPRNFGTYYGVEITQEEIDNGEWDDVELITLKGNNIGSLYKDGQMIDGYKKPIFKQLAREEMLKLHQKNMEDLKETMELNKQSAGRRKKRKRKKRRTRRRIKRKKLSSKKRKSRKRRRTKRKKKKIFKLNN